MPRSSQMLRINPENVAAVREEADVAVSPPFPDPTTIIQPLNSMLRIALGCLALSISVSCSPLTAVFREENSNANNWLNWNWNFGGAIATGSVHVVDRTPLLSFDARPAAFGPEFEDIPLLGYLIPLSEFTRPCDDENNTSNLGCSPLCVMPDKQLPDSEESWLALVQRGQCEFAEKIREAQRLGAKGAIVGNFETFDGGDGLVSMFSPEDATDINIPSTFIGYSSYESLIRLIRKSNTTHNGLNTISTMVTASYGGWEWYSPLLTFFSILLLPTLITFITLLVHRIRLSQRRRAERAPEDVVQKLAWSYWPSGGFQHLEKRYDQPPASAAASVRSQRIGDEEAGSAELENQRRQDMELSESQAEASTSVARPVEEESGPVPWYATQSECAICLSDFMEGEKIRILPCHHIFHLKEVDEWLVKVRKLCPICKFDVTLPFSKQSDSTPEDSSSSSSDSESDLDEETPLLTRRES